MKKGVMLILTVLTMLLVAIIGLLLYLIYLQKFAPPTGGVQSVIETPIETPARLPTVTPLQMTTTPMESVSPIQTPIPSPSVSDLDAIHQAFAQKYGKNVNDMTVTISKNTGVYASGGVTFAGEMGGGWFLAAKVGTSWKIVADGNGTIPCEAIAPYNFPTDMVPECWNQTTQKLIQR